jgi:hypothetical protein
MHRHSFLTALLLVCWAGHIAQAQDTLVWTFDINEQSVKNNAGEFDGSTNSPGSGVGTVTLNRATNTILYDFSWSGLIGDLTKLHIHGPASPEESNPQHIIEIFGPPEVPAELATTFGSVSDSFELQTLEQVGFDPIDPAYIIDTLVSGQAYLNVHTTVFGMGEIRGNLGQPVAQSVPEPSSILVLLVGVACFTARRTRN